ncbi:MAG: LacI family transcriptional regulator, partial [bacterium]|nr:LacI family transcriptional regulator [bacterium]
MIIIDDSLYWHADFIDFEFNVKSLHANTVYFMKKPTKHPPATIKDIAKEANVSPTTVSIALRNDKSSRVSDATRQNISAIAKRLNYRPNYTARALVAQTSYTLGLVITTLSIPFHSELAQDIITRAGEVGYSVLVGSARGGLEDEERSIHELLARGVDGLIICSAFKHDPAVTDLFRQSVPFVLAVRAVDPRPEFPPVNFIGVDNERGGYLVTEHLLRMGHTGIAFLRGIQEVSTGYNRYMGARKALEAYGAPPDPGLVFDAGFHRETGLRLTRELLASHRKFTAIVAASDHMAIGALDGLREAGVRVPDDVAVVGFGDIEMAGLPGVNLTTVTQKKTVMGNMAVDILLENITE